MSARRQTSTAAAARPGAYGACLPARALGQAPCRTLAGSVPAATLTRPGVSALKQPPASTTGRAHQKWRSPDQAHSPAMTGNSGQVNRALRTEFPADPARHERRTNGIVGMTMLDQGPAEAAARTGPGH